MKFTNRQIEFMKSIGIKVNLEIDLSDISIDDAYLIDEEVASYLQTKGFDERYEPTVNGQICEEILDILGEL